MQPTTSQSDHRGFFSLDAAVPARGTGKWPSGAQGFFSLDAAVASIALLLIAHSIISAHAHFAQLSLSRSLSWEKQSSVLQIADYLVLEGIAQKSDLPFPASPYSLHHELEPDWAPKLQLQALAQGMNLSYLSISAGGSSISTQTSPPIPLYCAGRLALLENEIALLEVCGA